MIMKAKIKASISQEIDNQNCPQLESINSNHQEG